MVKLLGDSLEVRLKSDKIMEATLILLPHL